MALLAHSKGYSLIETFETNALKEDAAFRALEELAVRLDADALVVTGPVDAPRVHEMADRVRLVVITTGK
jgi:hypothetical protein